MSTGVRCTVAGALGHALPMVAESSVVVGAVASIEKLTEVLVPVVPARFRCDADAVYEPVARTALVTDQVSLVHGVLRLAELVPVSAMRTVPAAVVQVPVSVGFGAAASEPSVGLVIATWGTEV